MSNPFNVPRQGPFQFFMNIAKQVKSVSRNPSQISNILLDQGAIDQETYQKVKGMNPSQIGEYLMQNGFMDQQQANALYQNVPQIQNMIN